MKLSMDVSFGEGTVLAFASHALLCSEGVNMSFVSVISQREVEDPG